MMGLSINDVVTARITEIDTAPPSSFATGRATVTTAGTQVQLSAVSVPVLNGVTIRANNANTGVIYVGGADVSSANGYELPPGMADFFAIDDLSKIWIDAEINIRGVSYWYNPA